MDPIIGATGTGLGKLATDYGIAGILGLLLIVGGIFIIRYFMDQFKACHENSMTQYKEEAAANRAVTEKNTEAFFGVQMAITKLEAKIK